MPVSIEEYQFSLFFRANSEIVNHHIPIISVFTIQKLEFVRFSQTIPVPLTEILRICPTPPLHIIHECILGISWLQLPMVQINGKSVKLIFLTFKFDTIDSKYTQHRGLGPKGIIKSSEARFSSFNYQAFHFIQIIKLFMLLTIEEATYQSGENA